MKSGDYEGALKIIENTRAGILKALGREGPGVDLLAEHPDLKARVDNQEISRADALELANNRRANAARQQQDQSLATAAAPNPASSADAAGGARRNPEMVRRQVDGRHRLCSPGSEDPAADRRHHQNLPAEPLAADDSAPVRIDLGHESAGGQSQSGAAPERCKAGRQGAQFDVRCNQIRA
jgi:hypothetical protein